MESPHLYETADYKKGGLASLKVKGGQNLFGEVGDYNDLNCELANSEISLDLQNFIDENQPSNQLVSEHLIQELQSLNVDKNALSNSLGGHCPRGLGANSSLGGIQPPLANTGMYGGGGVLTYLPQAVHSGSQFERQYHERIPIKEEPQDGSGDPHHEYPPCARVNYGGYGGGISPYPMTPTTVPGIDSLLKSPLKSPGALKQGLKTPKSDKSTDEYRRRRERNNIAVRKSREKAKARSRETEERVKLLTDENKKLQEKCKVLLEKVTMYHSVFSSMNIQCLPEPFRSEIRNQMEVLNSQHQHQQILGL